MMSPAPHSNAVKNMATLTQLHSTSRSKIRELHQPVIDNTVSVSNDVDNIIGLSNRKHRLVRLTQSHIEACRAILAFGLTMNRTTAVQFE